MVLNYERVSERIPALKLKRTEIWVVSLLLTILQESKVGMTARQLYQHDPQTASWFPEPRALGMKLKIWCGKPEFPIGITKNLNRHGLKEYGLKRWYLRELGLDMSEYQGHIVDDLYWFCYNGLTSKTVDEIPIAHRVYITTGAGSEEAGGCAFMGNQNHYITKVVATPDEVDSMYDQLETSQLNDEQE